MFSTLTQKLLVGVYIFILLSIPIGTYLASQYQSIESKAKEQKPPRPIAKITPKPSTSAAKQLLTSSESNLNADLLASPSPEPSSSSPTIATSFGPTLSLKVTLEGRPAGNQASKLFVGIAEGTLTSNPKFLLSFSIDVPASGEYSNLSLAGLSSGTSYTALIKGSAQIATTQAFTMSPTITNLNSGQSISLTTGDLNEDNVINSADFSIAQKALGSNSNSSNWNENADFNKDGTINTFDLGFITKNMGKTGATGAWVSPIPKAASASAGLTDTPPIGGPQGGTDGYWLWIPK